jgi:hypothetical protein
VSLPADGLLVDDSAPVRTVFTRVKTDYISSQLTTSHASTSEVRSGRVVEACRTRLLTHDARAGCSW